MSDQEKMSEIQKFYAGKCVFITGVSGYLGKAVLEKLLRSCPQLKSVYILLRPKKGVDVQLRLKSIFASPIFDTLKSLDGSLLSKVVAVSGDITLPNLGLSSSDRAALISNVSVVIHSAASVKFNEPIKVAMNINYHGTQRMLELCRELDTLASFVHVSTAFSNCDKEHIPEEIIAPPTPPKDLENWDDAEAEKITSTLLEQKPNSYTYTKALTEQMLKESKGALPVTIVRPSIIGPAWQEPQPGYIDSLGGYTGVVAASGKGFLTCMIAKGSNISDTIPLDIVVNTIIAAGYDTAKNTQRVNLPVYNCVSGPLKSLTWDNIIDYCIPTYDDIPFDNVLRYPLFFYTRNLKLFLLINFLLTYLPALIIDTAGALMGKKGRLVPAYNRLMASLVPYSYFTLRQWSFGVDNFKGLKESLEGEDNRLFYLNVEDIDWKFYMRNYVRGVKRWILKEDPKDLLSASTRMTRMYWIQKCLWGLLFFVLWNSCIKPTLGF